MATKDLCISPANHKGNEADRLFGVGALAREIKARSADPALAKKRRAPHARARAQDQRQLSLRKHGHRYANSRMSHIEQIVSAVDKVDIAVVGVSPSTGPGLRNLKVVAAVRKSRTALYDLDVTDREVMFMPEVSTKMLVRNTTVLFVAYLLVLLFLPGFFMFVAMLVLGKDGNHSCE